MKFIKLIKNAYFLRNKYSIFLNTLKDETIKKNCIVFLNLVNKVPTIIIIFDINILIFYKEDNQLIFKNFILHENYKELNPFLVDYIICLKKNSSSISNSSFIEYFVENIHSHKNFLKLTEDDIYFILKIAFSFNSNFFYNGNQLFIEEKKYNKWLD